MNEQAAPKNDVMHKVARQIMERRNLIFLIVVILLIFSVISRSWVSVENDLTTYLPETSGTRQALDIMEEEFTTYGTADVMVANIGPERAQELADQLALSLDYAIIFSNHFREEHETLPLKESVIEALSKSIPEISSSCLTTVGGLVAMMFMQFKIGPDMAICLIKAIAYSILSVFLVMPGLLMIFGPWMEKTEHKSFVPKIPFVGRFAYKTRKIIPPVFLVLVLILSFLQPVPLCLRPEQHQDSQAERCADRQQHDRRKLYGVQLCGPCDPESGLQRGKGHDHRAGEP